MRWLLASLGLLACQTPPERAIAPAVQCSGEMAVVALAPWPGGGVQLLLEGGAGARAEGWTTASAALGEIDGETLIVLEPGSDRAAVRAFIDALPAGERIGLAVGGGDARLLADLTRDRRHLAARLAALGEVAAGDDGGVRAALVEALAGVAGSPTRDLVVAGPDAVPDAGHPSVRGHALDGDGPALAADLRARRAALTRVGACGDGPLILAGAAGRCVVEPPVDAALAGAACDAEAAARDDYPFPAEIAIERSAEQRRAWDAADASASQGELELSIRLGGDALPARAHFRGQSSLACARKSLNVDLRGAAPRRLGPGFASDELLLISLCTDRGYFRQAFAERLFAAEGLFGLDRRFVRLTLDGEPRGVYWLLEKASDTLIADHLATRAVLRRRFDPDGSPPEVRWPDEAAARGDALERYRVLDDLALRGSPADVEAQLAARMDLDGYLRWLAFNSLLVNGDNIDEVYFHAVEEDGGWRFGVLPWDPDDLGSACHHGGQHAIDDACRVTYCAEANLDRGLLRSPPLYRRYLDALAGVLARWPAARLAGEMDAVAAELFAALADDATAAAMSELEPPAQTAAAAHATIRAAMGDLLLQIEGRRAVLETRLGECEAAR